MRLRNLAGILMAAALPAQSPETVAVKSGSVSRQVRLPGELHPFLRVELRARVNGYVESVEVDRGSAVKKGQVLIRLSAPELAAQVAEAEARAQAVEAQVAEAEAKALGAQSTFERLKQAAQTPGAIAGNELIVAGKQAEAARAGVKALESAAAAARASVQPLREMQDYLEIKAPGGGAGVRCGRTPQGRIGDLSSASLPRADLPRGNRADSGFARRANPDDGGGAGCGQSAGRSGAGHVSGSGLAVAARASFVVGSAYKCCHYQRTNLRDSCTPGEGRMGRCFEGRCFG
jgi:multidrug efflux pump subunit AcrA (membrane-fusion protein)